MEQYNLGFYGDNNIDWAGLPGLVLSLVAEKLNHATEFTRFGAVCTSWHAIYNDFSDKILFFDRILREPLLLMLPDVDDERGQLRILYSVNEKKVYKNFRLSVPHDEFCVGSSHGWLAMVSQNYELRLLNPFLSVNNEIMLPALPRRKLPRRKRKGVKVLYDITYVWKVVLSGDPISNPNYAIMAIHGDCNSISFYKRGDKEWTSLESKMNYVNDVIYSDDKFYAVSRLGETFSCDLNGPSPVVSIETPAHENRDESHYGRYLFKSGSDILHVTREHEYELKSGITENDFESDADVIDFDYYDIDRYYTDEVGVFRFDRNKREWNEVESLDGRILFVGDNSTLSLSTSDMHGCKPNCIYFTDDYHVGYFNKVGARDMGFCNLEDGSVQFFNLEDGSIQLCNLKDRRIEGLKMISPPPIFIQPSVNSPFNLNFVFSS